jgi:DNA-binding winged helix-turn-helix (wHTH) protein
MSHRVGFASAPLKWTLRPEKVYKRGLPIPLQEKPFQLLILLLERPGEIVTRDDLRNRLWSKGTYVDFDKGLNTAVKKLRYALGDSPDNPVFIQTLPRRGYRFIAPISGNGFAGDGASSSISGVNAKASKEQQDPGLSDSQPISTPSVPARPLTTESSCSWWLAPSV